MKDEIAAFVTGLINARQADIEELNKIVSFPSKIDTIRKLQFSIKDLNDVLDFVEDIPEVKKEKII